MLIKVLFPDEEKVKKYLSMVKERNASFSFPLWKMQIKSKRLPSTGVLVLFDITINLPIVYFLIFGAVLCGVISVLWWSPAYLGTVIFFVLSVFTSESFFYFGIKKGWRKLSKGKIAKINSNKTVRLLMEDAKIWDR